MSFYSLKEKDYFSAARREVLDLIPAFSKRVLEVGCGSGQTLEMLKANDFCSETVGVELIEAAANEARERVDTVHCLDVEKNELPINFGKFDLILLLDVLEHLVDPWNFLRKIKDHHLADGGKIIVSLPNAQHFSLVLPLLRGRFSYVERGILDKTHLRFFTRSSAADLLKSALLKIEIIKPTSLDLGLTSGKVNLVTLGVFSGFLASQYIFLTSAENDI